MKNTVEINKGKSQVKKYFHSRIACDTERNTLARLCGSQLSPDLLDYGEHTITTEYCTGITLGDFVKEASCDDCCRLFLNAVKWLLEFHRLTGLVLCDMNPSNFIVNTDVLRIKGIDFENVKNGALYENLASLLSMAENTYFPFSEKLSAYLKDYYRNNFFCDYREILKKAAQATQITVMRRRAMPLVRQTDCVILAGGKSSRMGTDKGRLALGGYTFTEHIINTASVFDRTYISADDISYGEYGLPLINDIYKDCGPMGALYSAFSSCNSQWIFTIPCDTPLISRQEILRLFALADTDAQRVVFKGDKVYPTIALYNRSILPLIKEKLEKGELKMMKLLDSVKTQYIETEDNLCFTNANTPRDYEFIKMAYKKFL